jgi:hypothetical protein
LKEGRKEEGQNIQVNIRGKEGVQHKCIKEDPKQRRKGIISLVCQPNLSLLKMGGEKPNPETQTKKRP